MGGFAFLGPPLDASVNAVCQPQHTVVGPTGLIKRSRVMSNYKMGRDVGELFARVQALEEKAARCICDDTAIVERVIRPLTSEEEKILKGKGNFCVYFVGGFVGNPCKGINIGDFICVSPCPPCSDIPRLKIVDAKGKPLCTLIVRVGAAGACGACPAGGHQFTWV
jgi:hypothetical protein